MLVVEVPIGDEAPQLEQQIGVALVQPTAFTKIRWPARSSAKNGVEPRASTLAGRTAATATPERPSASPIWSALTRPLGDPPTRWTKAPTVQPSTKPATTSRGRWAPTKIRAAPTVIGSTQTQRRQRRARKGTAVAARAAETAAWPEGKPRPFAAGPWTTTPLISAAGRSRFTRCFRPIAA